MKEVFITKSAYKDNSVKVSYWEKDHLKLIRVVEGKNIEIISDLLLFCERLYWNASEEELSVKIEETRKKYEEQLNK